MFLQISFDVFLVDELGRTFDSLEMWESDGPSLKVSSSRPEVLHVVVARAVYSVTVPCLFSFELGRPICLFRSRLMVNINVDPVGL